MARRTHPSLFLTGYGIPAIIAMLGVLKTGRAYASVDPGNPQARIIEIIDDTQSDLIVTDNKNCSLAENSM